MTYKVGDILESEHDIRYVIEVHERSAKIGQIEPERLITVRQYSHEFRYLDEPGAGYGLPAYEDGTPLNKERFEEVRQMPGLKYLGLQSHTHHWNEPASIRCRCGNEVWLTMIMTNTCDRCHRDYNISGQLLADRSQWGEETGETASDILMSDRSI
jgi:hypothetical protein